MVTSQDNDMQSPEWAVPHVSDPFDDFGSACADLPLCGSPRSR